MYLSQEEFESKARDLGVAQREKEVAEETIRLQKVELSKMEEKVNLLLEEQTRNAELVNGQRLANQIMEQQHTEKAKADQTAISKLVDEIASLKSHLEKSCSEVKLEQDKVATIQSTLDTTMSDLRAAEVRDDLTSETRMIIFCNQKIF